MCCRLRFRFSIVSCKIDWIFYSYLFFFLHSCNENEARLWNPTKRHVYLKLFELFFKLVLYAYAWLCSVLVLHFTTNTQNHCFVAAIEIIKCAQHAFNQLKIQFECLFKALSQKKKKKPQYRQIKAGFFPTVILSAMIGELFRCIN